MRWKKGEKKGARRERKARGAKERHKVRKKGARRAARRLDYLFFNHFPTNFLRAYSVADPRPDEKHRFSSD